MPFNPRLPLLATTTLSLLLTLTTLSTSANLLSTFTTSSETNPWLLPLWTSHIDTTPLKAQISTTTLILISNILTVLTLTLIRKPFLTFLTALTSTILALVTIALPSTLYTRSNIPDPAKVGRLDTLQTWTCRWNATPDSGAPEMFGRLCVQSQYTLYSAIPILVLQLILVGLAVVGLRNLKRGSGDGVVTSRGMLVDAEKGNGVVIGERGITSSSGGSVGSKGSGST